MSRRHVKLPHSVGDGQDTLKLLVGTLTDEIPCVVSRST